MYIGEGERGVGKGRGREGERGVGKGRGRVRGLEWQGEGRRKGLMQTQ